MKIRHLTFFLILWPLSLYADTGFNDLFNTELDIMVIQADRVATYHAEDIKPALASTQTELEMLNQTLEQVLQQQPQHPILWFIKGLNYSNLAAYHADSDRKLSLNYNEKKQQAYIQAMALDNNKSPHLTAAIYATMKHGLPLNDKITALQKELSLGGNGENESYYWYLHWSNINSLQQAGRQQEAQQALMNMQKEMKTRGLDQSVYQQLVSQAKESIEQPKTITRTARSQADTAEMPSQETPPQSLTMRILWLLITLSVVLFIVAVIYERLQHKKNQNKR